MIKGVEEAILESLRKGLSTYIPPENILAGELDQSMTKSISLINTGFTAQDQSIGNSGGVKSEECVEKISSDGKKKEFKLSKKPMHPLIIVESPVGTEKRYPDDFSYNYAENIIIFKSPPEKGKDNVRIKFTRAVAKMHNFKFILNYTLNIVAEDLPEINQLTLEAIKLLYREKDALVHRGIDEIKLIRGYTEKISGTKKVNIIEYQVETTIQIEIPYDPIDKIDIKLMD